MLSRSMSKQTAKKLPRRELEYIAVQASEEVVRLEQYVIACERYITELLNELDELDEAGDDQDSQDSENKDARGNPSKGSA